MDKRKIYVASSWRNKHLDFVISTLRGHGHEVYDFRNPPNGDKGFSWSDIDPDWQKWSPLEYRAALCTLIATKGFVNDKTGMDWCNTCVLLLPSGRSAHSEAGFLSGSGKKVYVLYPEGENFEPELMYRLYHEIITSWDMFNMNFFINKH